MADAGAEQANEVPPEEGHTKGVEEEPTEEPAHEAEPVEQGAEEAQAAEVTEDVKAEEEPAEQRSQAEQGERKGKEREQEQERRKERQREGEGEKEGRRRMPVRQYLDTTVVPILREGLRKLVKNRPEDPIGFLIEYLQEHRTSQSPGSQQ